MNPGQTIAGRFQLQELAGSGGMGMVYRALDTATGRDVALKVLRRENGQEQERFLRESRVLAELDHPSIVRHVAHGTTESGDPYLAMEWLSGEDLQVRLARTPISVGETLIILGRVASALAAAHAHNIIHRDIKPSNIFLQGASIDHVKLLDFGIARVNRETMTATSIETTLGTPEYMSPEQARGIRELDARSDIFSLGCVAFECLTGKPAFSGSHLMALLARVLLEDAPRVRDLRPEVPEALDELVASMMARDPSRRSADGSALVQEIAALDGVTAKSADLVPAARMLTKAERRLLSVILAKGAVDVEPGSAIAPTLAASASAPTFDTYRRLAQAHGAALEHLADGTLILTLSATGAATDQACAAARCALALRGLAPNAPAVLATGPGDLSARGPAGEVLERAARLLRATIKEGAAGTPVRTDDITAGLLDARFELAVSGGTFELLSERQTFDSARTLLGREGPCVGRERELDTLEALFEECVSEPMAHAVLITGPAGVGKSRLRYELLRRIARRGHEDVWLARGDPMSAASPFGMLGSALRQALGISQAESLDVQRLRLRSTIALRIDASERERVTEFLGELAGVPFPADSSVQLRAARQDAMLMGDQMRRAWEDFVAAECGTHPVILVLEDLQWGDLPTVTFVDAALRTPDRPLLVVAVARPEVVECFPRIWAGRPVTHIQLDKLTRKASEKLVRQFLGDAVKDDVLHRIVDRAAGNAFYLEEIIRSVAEGRGEDLPETVIAMVQARIEGFDVDARRILRAASVFGQTFWRGGVLALLGDDERTIQASERLEELLEKEIIVRQGKGRLPGEEEFSFRHAIQREAAYAMLTAGDRVLGHRLAAEWLQRAGERDAIVLAEHLERGNEPARAVAFYLRAAEQALEGDDLDLAISRADRGIRAGAQGAVLGALLLVLVEAYHWRGQAEAESAERCATRAIEVLEPRSAGWYVATGEAAAAACRRGVPEMARRFHEQLDPGADVASQRAQVVAASRVAVALLATGGFAEATALLSDLPQRFAALLEADPAACAWMYRAQALRAVIEGDPTEFLRLSELAADRFELAGYARNACLQRTNAGVARMELGAFAEAETTLVETLRTAERCGLPSVAAATRHALGLALARLGQVDEAMKVEGAAAAAFEQQSNPRMEGGCRVYLASILLSAGRLDEALAEARRAVGLLERAPPALACALGMVAEVQLAQGRPRDALYSAEQAMQILKSLGALEEGEARVRLVHAESLKAAGQEAPALEAILVAKEKLEARAAKIGQPAYRTSFLSGVPENARVMALARAWSSPG